MKPPISQSWLDPVGCKVYFNPVIQVGCDPLYVPGEDPKIAELESELGHVRAERDGQMEGNDKLNRRNAELESKISGLREFFRTYGIANLDDFMEHAAD